jgi:hypothetical protein
MSKVLMGYDSHAPRPGSVTIAMALLGGSPLETLERGTMPIRRATIFTAAPGTLRSVRHPRRYRTPRTNVQKARDSALRVISCGSGLLGRANR